MSVVSPQSSKVIFCEGKGNSLDSSLLNKVLDNLSDKPTIIPAGGKFSFSIFAQGYFSKNQSTNQRYIVFRDRDFDIKPTDNIELLKLGKHTFCTHRACIENYLLDANLIDTYWRVKYIENQENPSFQWGHKDSPGIEAISTWIENAARTYKIIKLSDGL